MKTFKVEFRERHISSSPLIKDSYETAFVTLKADWVTIQDSCLCFHKLGDGCPTSIVHAWANKAEETKTGWISFKETT